MVDNVGVTTVDSVLQMIGFIDDGERNGIMIAGLAQFDDFRYLNEKDIRDMADEFGKRTAANGRIVFGLGRTKKLVGAMHWVQDCYRSNDQPEQVPFDEQALFGALSLSQVRKSDVELVATNAKAVDPGKFKDEPNPEEGREYSTATERMIARASLQGQFYEADSRRVHNLLLGFYRARTLKIGFEASLDTKMEGVTWKRCDVTMQAKTPDYRISRRISAANTGTTSGRGGRGARGNGRGGQGRGNNGRGRGGRGGRGGNEKTTYYSPAEWEKLSYEERDRIRKERDKKGEPGGTKRSISEMTTKQLTTALISSLQKPLRSTSPKIRTPRRSQTQMQEIPWWPRRRQAS
ncbi:hypothetical protein MHU86_21810 [Fragilaria crotonensis]|nr:hypothetical protein MHU86_21810 [Fragilaria crotonensis]